MLLGPSFVVSRDKACNVDHLSHVVSSDSLMSSDKPKTQLITLGHSPHNIYIYIYILDYGPNPGFATKKKKSLTKPNQYYVHIIYIYKTLIT